MTRHRPSRPKPLAAAAAAVLAVFLVAGCTSGLSSEGSDAQAPASDEASTDEPEESTTDEPETSADEQPDGQASDGETGTTLPENEEPPPTDPAGSAADGTLIVAEECLPAPGTTVTNEPDVIIDAVEEESSVEETTTVAGEEVPGFEVGAFSLSEHVIDAGCVIEHDAPGGCLGAVEITGVRIPGAAIPGFRLPDAEVGGRTAEGEVVQGDSVPGDFVPGASTPQVCQQLPSDDSRYIASVNRPSVSRSSASRSSLSRTSASREAMNVEGDRLNSAYVDSAYVDSVYVDSVYVASERIDSVDLPESDTEVFSNDEQSSYFTSADVLFDFGRAEVKPEAVPTLQAIAADLNENYTTGTIQVEGHTDSIDDDAFNQTLSEQRAEAIKQWLVTQGGIPADRIATLGYGETVPVVPNTNPDGSDNPAGRAENRRVVITAAES